MKKFSFFVAFVFCAFFSFVFGDGITVAVLDSGVNVQDSDFEGKIMKWEETFLGKYLKTVIDETSSKDSGNANWLHSEANALLQKIKKGYLSDNYYNYHGTCVASILAEGMSNINLLPIKISLNNSRDGFDTFTAVTLARDIGAKIVNLSYGPANSSSYINYMSNLRSVAESFPDMLFVISAGNQGLNLGLLQDKDYLNLKNVIVVGAIDEEGEMERYSQFGSDFVDVVALGTCTKNIAGRSMRNGTSFSTPRIAQSAAKIMRANSTTLSPSQVKTLIREYAYKEEHLLMDTRYGGPVDEYAAVEAARSMVPEVVQSSSHISIPVFSETALFIAIECGLEKTLEMLIENKFDVETKINGQTLLHIAASYGHYDIAKYLIKKGAKVNVEDKNRSTPLLIALNNGHPKVAKLLINDKNIEINKENKWGVFPLYLIAKMGYVDLAKMLVGDKAVKKANINQSTKNKLTALHIASYMRQSEILSLLVDNGADVNCKNNSGMTPLHFAAINGDLSIAQILTDSSKIKVNIIDNKNETSLHKAVANSRSSIVSLLLKKKAKRHLRNSQGLTALDIAKNKNNKNMIKLF